MTEIIMIVLVVVFIFLGVRLYFKFRVISTWKDEDIVIDGTGKTSVPQELRELKIDIPPADSIGSQDLNEGKNSSENKTPPKQTP